MKLNRIFSFCISKEMQTQARARYVPTNLCHLLLETEEPQDKFTKRCVRAKCFMALMLVGQIGRPYSCNSLNRIVQTRDPRAAQVISSLNTARYKFVETIWYLATNGLPYEPLTDFQARSCFLEAIRLNISNCLIWVLRHSLQSPLFISLNILEESIQFMSEELFQCLIQEDNMKLWKLRTDQGNEMIWILRFIFLHGRLDLLKIFLTKYQEMEFNEEQLIECVGSACLRNHFEIAFHMLPHPIVMRIILGNALLKRRVDIIDRCIALGATRKVLRSSVQSFACEEMRNFYAEMRDRMKN